ncbi:MAG: T9SS type A sorting domain-containing protein [Bacteroidota bacterium]
MKKILIFLLLNFFVAESLFAQSEFNFRYGSSFFDRARKTIKTKDGNFIVVGRTNGFGSAGNAFMMKVNQSGNILWLKDYDGINQEEFFDVIEAQNGNIVECGTTESYGAGNYDAVIMETDSIGNMLWAKAYGNVYAEYFFKISEDAANGFYVAGLAQKVPSFTTGTVLLKIDSEGNIIWNRWVAAWCSEGDWYPIDMTKTLDGGVLLTGCYNHVSCWKFSSAGNLIWSNSYSPDGGGFSEGLSILEDVVGNIYLNSIIYGVASSVDIAILKLQSNGNFVWLKSYGGTYTDEDRSISNTSDTGIIISGFTNSAGNGDFDACLIKLNHFGSVQWAKAYGGAWNESTANAIQTSDGGYLFTGQTFPLGTNNDSSKVYLVKTNSLGNSSCNSVSWSPIEGNETVTVSSTLVPDTITLHENPISWSVNSRSFYEINICDYNGLKPIDANDYWEIFPNPATNEIKITNLSPTENQISIYNLLGQQVKSIRVSNVQSTILPVSDLPAGIYVVTIFDGEKIVCKKFVKE